MGLLIKSVSPIRHPALRTDSFPAVESSFQNGNSIEKTVKKAGDLLQDLGQLRREMRDMLQVNSVLSQWQRVWIRGIKNVVKKNLEVWCQWKCCPCFYLCKKTDICSQLLEILQSLCVKGLWAWVTMSQGGCNAEALTAILPNIKQLRKGKEKKMFYLFFCLKVLDVFSAHFLLAVSLWYWSDRADVRFPCGKEVSSAYLQLILGMT